MPKFDPWPIFFRREWNRNWPFLVGFAITGTIITKLSLGLTGNLSLPLSLSRSFQNLIWVISTLKSIYRGGCKELSFRAEAQEVNFKMPDVVARSGLLSFPLEGEVWFFCFMFGNNNCNDVLTTIFLSFLLAIAFDLNKMKDFD
ncbi:hypothetical protein HHK36_032019 [Tetracentron sinense]|uniref:Uncharacterized protein n=1 Tax=Tetracentron sinense TaxID=13715 RepID=A0A834YA63_TETSI|nr:hypothetical protein HHK36_032019 [Tetracentron sinense]